jgi:D-beta-D-heptose 7-phosphate kinase/D-beta-D-heptose 1-phosphate adenosyltransferase
MRRAVFIDVTCFANDLREDRLLEEVAREYLPLPVVPAAVDWKNLDPGNDVESSASWLVTGPEAPCCCEPALVGAFRGCIAVGTGTVERAAADNGWRSAPDLAAALSRIRRETLASRVLTDYEAVAAIARRLRQRGRRVVFTNGVFDLFHIGHLRMLEAARGLGDTLVVGVNGDDSASRLKGRRRPLVPQFARAALVAGARPVRLVAIFGEDTPLELLRAVRPHVLVKGGEYRPSQVVGRQLVDGWGGEVVVVSHVDGASTSGLIERIRGRAPKARTRRAAGENR